MQVDVTLVVDVLVAVCDAAGVNVDVAMGLVAERASQPPGGVEHETIDALDVVDLNDNVFATAPEFAETNRNVMTDPRLSLIHDDGRSFLKRTDRRYDLVTSEPPPPRNEGVYRLYSREYYQSVLEHLTPNGMMTQWLPSYQMAPEASALIVRTFIDAFPHTLLFTGDRNEYVLVGSPAPIDLTRLERQFAAMDERSAVRQDLHRVGIDQPIQVLARVIHGDTALRERFARGRVISDRRNDLARHVVDPASPIVFMYDPLRVLADIGADALESGETLRRTVLDLARLKTAVPDFPSSALMAVRLTDAGDAVASAHADWIQFEEVGMQVFAADIQGRTREEIDLLRRSLEIVPDHPTTLARIAIVQRRIGQVEPSLATWQRCLARMPEFAHAHLGAGRMLLELDRVDEAVTHLRRATELAPASAPYRTALGDALARTGDTAAATRAYNAAMALEEGDALSPPPRKPSKVTQVDPE